jgi:hypothetical protein
MHYAQLTDAVRRHARRRMESLGANPLCDTVETILVRDGYYCGRRLECDGMSVVWFVEENQLKFYHRDGSVTATCTVDDLLQDDRRQAA